MTLSTSTALTAMNALTTLITLTALTTLTLTLTRPDLRVQNGDFRDFLGNVLIDYHILLGRL